MHAVVILALLFQSFAVPMVPAAVVGACDMPTSSEPATESTCGCTMAAQASCCCVSTNAPEAPTSTNGFSAAGICGCKSDAAPVEDATPAAVLNETVQRTDIQAHCDNQFELSLSAPANPTHRFKNCDSTPLCSHSSCESLCIWLS